LLCIFRFAGTIRVSILCDTIRRDVLGDENIRATAFNIKQEQQQQQLPIITMEPDDAGGGENGQDGILNQLEPMNDATMTAPIERSFE
jgi:hypothetical protein